MGSWSATRRLIYLLAVLLVLGGLAAGLFIFYHPKPSCTDGWQNQDEKGVDCGGVCAKVCLVEVTPLRVVWTRIFVASAGKYDAATFLINPNLQLGVKELHYTVKVFDKNNLLVTIRQGQAFVNPKENLLVFDSRLEVGRREPARALFELNGAPIWQRVTRPPPLVTTAIKNFVAEPRPHLSASITNNSLVDLANVEVAAALSDSAENAIAVSSTLVEHLDHGTTQDLVFTWPQALPAAPAFINLYPHFDLSKL